MKRTAVVVGCLALIGLFAWSVLDLGQAMAQNSTGELSTTASATYACGSGCDHHPEGTQGDPAKCQQQCQNCKDGKGCKDCPNCQSCPNCKDCKDYKDADGDGKCDSVGKCAQHGSDKGACHEKSACPRQKCPRGGGDHDLR